MTKSIESREPCSEVEEEVYPEEIRQIGEAVIGGRGSVTIKDILVGFKEGFDILRGKKEEYSMNDLAHECEKEENARIIQLAGPEKVDRVKAYIGQADRKRQEQFAEYKKEHKGRGFVDFVVGYFTGEK